MDNKEAIEVLEQMRANICNDYRWLALDLAVKALKDRPQGKWITHQTSYLLWEECDQCKAQVGTVGMNFCPNCGADMRGSDHE